LILQLESDVTMLPREHGVYGQVALPLLTALLVAGVSAASVTWTAAVVAVFAAHEPMLILLGRRGARLRRAQRLHAALAFAVAGVSAFSLALLAVALADPAIRWSFLVPCVPALIVAGALATGTEKDWLGEVSVALTFSLAAIPAVMTAGATPRTAWGLGLGFAVIFVAETLAVRSVVLRVRAGGNRRAASLTAGAVMFLSLAATVGLAVAVSRQLLPTMLLGAVSPPLLVAMVIAARAPRATRLRAIGWSLVAVTTFAAALMVAALKTL
jgi:hypothetical protein